MSKTCKIVVVGSFITDITGFAPRFPGDGETVLGVTKYQVTAAAF